MLHEQNAVLGRVNRLLAGEAEAIGTAYDQVDRLKPRYRAKTALVGNPVREEIAQARRTAVPAVRRDRAAEDSGHGREPGRDHPRRGRSRGLGLLQPSLRRRLQIVQQCRPDDIERVRSQYADLGIPAELMTYIVDMPDKLADAHLVIGRAGASTIAELTAAGRPAILIPFAAATDDHQTANAREMTKAGGARTIQQSTFTPGVLARQIEAMAADPQALDNAAARALSVGRPHAARDLADLVERVGKGVAPVAVGPVLSPRTGPCSVGRSAGMMKAMGTDIGTIHFVGIGGIGMSGIAEVMHQLGYKVQGSDVADSYVVEKLRKAGIPISIGHSTDNLGDAAVVVCSSAIKDNNPEIEAAAQRRLPRVKRAEMLAELMRMQKTVAVAGTHGKTTTTSMIAALLDGGGIDPTVINGGIINRYGSNARLGKSDWWVIEADESDGSFLRLDGTIAVVTNIDPEHLEHYGDFDAVKDAFVEFIENVPFYGLAVLCVDHPEVQNIIGRIRDRRIVTYGFSALADVRADNVTPVPGGSCFDA